MLKRLIIVFTFLFVSFFAWFFLSTRPVIYKQTSPVEFEIKSGWGTDRISQELSSQKLIRSRTAFKLTAIVMGISSHIQAGYFRLSPNMTITEIAQKLTSATTKQVRVTIPEGLRRQEIALIFEKAFGSYEGKTFAAADFVSRTSQLEGRLFPDTYDFEPQASASSVIAKLTSKFNSVINELEISEDDLSRVLITASLLEREAANSKEMPQIAGVIQNRLSASWPLQIDATVQYALSSVRCTNLDCDWWPGQLTAADLKIESAYNTYQRQGLPPAPISSPGLAALKAARSPEKTSAWFYLHDKDGQIHFADTIEGHNQNVCRYLQKDCL